MAPARTAAHKPAETANLPAVTTAVRAMAPALKNTLPKAIPSDRFIQIIEAQVRKNPELLEADPNSVVEACEKAAADGLLLDGREAALVIYNDRRNNKKTAQYIPMWQGILKRVYNSGQISSMQAYVVYEEEINQGLFHYYAGDEERIEHTPILTGTRGRPAVVYTIVRMKDGSKSRELMTAEEILRIAKRSPKNVDRETGQLKGIWKSDFIEMAKKTVIRRHAKKLPVDSDTFRVFERIDDLYRDENGNSFGGDVESPDQDIDAPATPRKRKGAAAAALNGEILEADPETGEILEPEPARRPAPQAQRRPAPPAEDQDDTRFAPPPADYEDVI